MEAREIFENVVERGLNFGGLTKKEFTDGIMANYGVDSKTANEVARMSGNW